MRRTAFLFVLLVAAIGGVALAGCGQEEEQTATPETVVGETPTTETTETETTETDETETETTETDETETDETETTTGPAVEGDPAAGKEVFLGASACGGCHTLADAGTSGSRRPEPRRRRSPTTSSSLDRVTNGQGGMPSFSSTLSEQQIADVAAYVSSVAGS